MKDRALRRPLTNASSN